MFGLAIVALYKANHFDLPPTVLVKGLNYINHITLYCTFLILKYCLFNPRNSSTLYQLEKLLTVMASSVGVLIH